MSERRRGPLTRLRSLWNRFRAAAADASAPGHEISRYGVMLPRAINSCSDGRCVSTNYRKSPREEPSARVIEIGDGLHYRGVLMIREWHIEFRITEPCWRTFRLDRILSAYADKRRPKKLTRSPLTEGGVVEWSPAEMDVR